MNTIHHSNNISSCVFAILVLDQGKIANSNLLKHYAGLKM